MIMNYSLPMFVISLPMTERTSAGSGSWLAASPFAVATSSIVIRRASEFEMRLLFRLYS